jgi:hypothetical protein
MNDADRQEAIDELVELGEDRETLESMTGAQLAMWAAQVLLANAPQVAGLLRDARTDEFPEGVPQALIDQLLASAAQTVSADDDK